jgi:hypothetical protein
MGDAMMKNPTFVLHCTYVSGYTWSAELKVMPLKIGFAITGFLSTDDENGIQKMW